MDETVLSNSVKKRLAMQNEVYKWMAEFSERMEKRSKEATNEVNGLLDQAGILEADLKNTFNLFRSLSHTRYIDHRIADDNDMYYHKKKNVNHSVECIPAQNYVTDILPRYKEALSLGLISCIDYLSAHSTTSARSFFSTAAVHGQLPYIIWSKEYNHDSSCGLTDDIALSQQQPLDFTRLAEPSGVSSVAADHAPSDLFGLRMHSMRQDTPRKDGSESLVSAASDFKAMLEAALLSTYKFYDDESFYIHDPRSTGGTKTDMVCIRMEQTIHINGSNAAEQSNGGIVNHQGASMLSQADCENKKAAIHAEMTRLNKLPSNSSYAVHRVKVLNKILNLLSIPVSKRTISQGEELELLFAGLSL